jgi:hypothetical protein
MQLNFPMAVITAMAFALGLDTDVPSEFSLSRSLIKSSTLAGDTCSSAKVGVVKFEEVGAD